MKNVIVQIFIMVFTVLFVLFGINYLYNGEIGSGKGFFAGIGSVLSGRIETPIVSNGINALENTTSGTEPVLRYTGGARHIGDVVDFKTLFEISLDGNSFVPAYAENGFAIYFYDLTSLSGESIVEKLTTEEIAMLEEFPAAILYDTKLYELYFHQSGTFCIWVSIYLDSGEQYLYECIVPVEVK